MKKAIEAMEERYSLGIDLMKDEGLPAITYVASVIMALLTWCLIDPNNQKAYIVIFGLNIVGTYLWSYISKRMYKLIKVIRLRTIFCLKFLIYFIFLITLIIITSRYIVLWKAVVSFISPIAISVAMIFIEESFFLREHHFLITTCGTSVMIIIPLIFLEWNPFVKIAIILGYVFSMPLITWGCFEEYSIFEVLGIDW